MHKPTSLFQPKSGWDYPATSRRGRRSRMTSGTGDEYEATWRRDAKLVLVPRVDPSIRWVDGRPLASKKMINVKMHKPTSLFQPKKKRGGWDEGDTWRQNGSLTQNSLNTSLFGIIDQKQRESSPWGTKVLPSIYLRGLTRDQNRTMAFKEYKTASHFMDDWSKLNLNRSKTMEFQKFP